MTPEQLDVVRTTAAMVVRDNEPFARCFYGRLCELNPDARRLFPVDAQAERCELVDEIVLLAAAAGDLPAFLERAREVGRRQCCHGVAAGDYRAIGDALVHAVAAVVGPSWSVEAEQAWRRFFALMADTMLEGASGVLFTGPG